MTKLARYVFSSVFWSVLLTLLVLSSVFIFFDLIAELGDVGKNHYQLKDAVIYVLLTFPSRVYELLPVAVLIGSIFALSGMADSSQITVMRAADLVRKSYYKDVVKPPMVENAINGMFKTIEERFQQTSKIAWRTSRK